MLKELILSVPQFYRLFQFLNGAGKMRRILSSEFICAKGGMQLLDIACGTADIRPYLSSDVHYTGIDSSFAYIANNQRRYSGDVNTDFICEDLNDYVSHTDARYDFILLMGVLHHIPDEQVCSCLSALPSLLKPGGRILTMDGVFTDDMNSLERFLLNIDRGKYVRRLEDWKSLVYKCIPEATFSIRKDFYYLPYQQILFQYKAGT